MNTTEPKAWKIWTGRVMSALPALLMIVSGAMKLTHHPKVVEGFVGKFGFQESAITGIGILEILCVVIYLVPRTAVLGAILMTGYLGGAVVTHLRVGDAFIMPALVGALAWGGLYFRDPRIAALIPLRK